MADNIDPNLLRLMRPPGPGKTITPGAGAFGDNPFLLRQLQSLQPRIIGGMGKAMPGFAPAKPGAGHMPNKTLPYTTEQEMQEGAPNDIMPPGFMDSNNMKGFVNKPVQGGNLDPLKAERAPYMNANDSKNILQQRLDNMRAKKGDDNYMYDMALTWQKSNRKQEPEKPIFTTPATVSPLGPNITPRQPLGTKQIYGAATKLEALGNKEDAQKARQYNFQTERFRDKIKDYHLARSDLQGWVEKNAVPDIDQAMLDLDKLNNNLIKTGNKPFTMMEFKELKRYELQNKMRNQGVDNFYNELKSNLTTMHSELDRIHKLIETNSGE